MATDAILLELVTPDREVVHESVAEIQIPAKNGYLGVLPGHTPLLAELGIGTLSYHKGSEVRYVAVLGGFVEVLPDRVTVLADAAERAEEIDAAGARAGVDKAQKEMAAAMGNPAADWDHVLQDVAAANTRLEVAGHAGGAGTAAH
jgi:F-type H+-transporting ATPase subunit epsilon